MNLNGASKGRSKALCYKEKKGKPVRFLKVGGGARRCDDITTPKKKPATHLRKEEKDSLQNEEGGGMKKCGHF